MKLISLIIAICLFTEVYAQSTYLKKGDITPNEGILFDITTAKKMRNDLIDKDTNEKMIDSYKKSIDLKDLSIKIRKEQVDMLMEQNDKLIKQKEASEYEKYLWFGLGIFIMGGAVWGAGQLRK